MAASANDISNERRYICTSVIITPASKRPAQWGKPHEIPESESLPYSGSTQEGVRKELVEFIALSGLPITLEPAPGMGAATGGPLIASSKLLLTLTKFALQIGKVINRLHRNHQNRQRRLHLPIAHVMLILGDTTETFIPLVALLPDLQKYLKEKFPSLQLDISIHGSKTALLTEPGMIFDEAFSPSHHQAGYRR